MTSYFAVNLALIRFARKSHRKVDRLTTWHPKVSTFRPKCQPDRPFSPIRTAARTRPLWNRVAGQRKSWAKFAFAGGLAVRGNRSCDAMKSFSKSRSIRSRARQGCPFIGQPLLHANGRNWAARSIRSRARLCLIIRRSPACVLASQQVSDGRTAVPSCTTPDASCFSAKKRGDAAHRTVFCWAATRMF